MRGLIARHGGQVASVDNGFILGEVDDRANLKSLSYNPNTAIMPNIYSKGTYIFFYRYNEQRGVHVIIERGDTSYSFEFKKTGLRSQKTAHQFAALEIK